jgi:hypothetical protein
MEKYKVPTLTSSTPQAEQSKLLSALRGVKGVESAQLHPSTSEVAIGGKGQNSPKREEIATAASAAGFPFAPKG